MTSQEDWGSIMTNPKIIVKGVMKLQTNLEIKDYLEEKGISQTFVSKKTGIPLPKLNLALNGNRRLTLEEYTLICGALGVNTDFFLKPRLPDVEK